MRTVTAFVLSAWVLFLINSVSAAAADSIQWHDDPVVAWEQAKREQRPLLLYFTAEWCSYCHKMERDVWSDAEIAKPVHARFVAVKVDADKHANLVSQLGVEAFPCTLIANTDGKIRHTATGFVPAVKLRPLLERAIRFEKSSAAKSPTKSAVIKPAGATSAGRQSH